MTQENWLYGQNVVRSMQTKVKSAVCQKFPGVIPIWKNSPVCIGLVDLAYCVPQRISLELSHNNGLFFFLQIFMREINRVDFKYQQFSENWRQIEHLVHRFHN